MRKKVIWLPLAAIFFLIPTIVMAQTIVSAEIIQLDASEFPLVTGYLNVRDDTGAFFEELKSPNFFILEDGNKVMVDELVAAKPGTQFIVAISPTNAFKIRDSQGNSRYDYLQGVLTTWSELLAPTANDSISLVTSQGNLLMGEEDPANFTRMLLSYQPDFEVASPNLDILSRAIDLAADSPPRTGMGRVVLFVSSAPPDDTVEVIRGIADRAIAQKVKVLVWLVDSSAYFENPGATALREMADQTGGMIYPFSGVEPLPEIDVHLEPFHYIYKFSYQSTIIQTGTFPITAELQYEETTLQTEPYDIEVLVQAPSPAIIDPPDQIFRSFSTEFETQTEDLQPLSQKIEILIEFGDQIDRNIVRSSLFVDNELAAENLSAPFTSFTWDISEIDHSAAYMLRFEVEDEFGLVGSSIETPVNVTVQIPPDNVRVFIDRYGTGLVVLVLAITGGILLLTLFFSGKLTPQPISARKQRKRNTIDPVTQPLGSTRKPQPFRFSKAGKKNDSTDRLKRLTKGKESQIASLIALEDQESDAPTKKLFINKSRTVVGSDPAKADLILEDITIAPGHARIETDNDSDFMIFDNNSVAGTYINFEPVDQNGKRLLHGDIVHFGCFGFCFELKNPDTIGYIKIIQPKEES